MISLEKLNSRLAEYGLSVRGGFAVRPSDRLPDVSANLPSRSLVLVGSTGGGMWPHFSKFLESSNGITDPLNSWTQNIVDSIAAEFGAHPLYPFGEPPYHPFVSWATRSGGVFPSPLGLAVDPEYGLWHAYRAALLISEELSFEPPAQVSSPCDTCIDMPCLTACPVEAFREQAYHPLECAKYLREAPGNSCLSLGCAARHACPAGRSHTYAPVQARFHQTAFLSSHTKR